MRAISTETLFTTNASGTALKGRVVGLVVDSTGQTLFHVKWWPRTIASGRFVRSKHVHKFLTFDELTARVSGPNPTFARAQEAGIE